MKAAHWIFMLLFIGCSSNEKEGTEQVRQDDLREYCSQLLARSKDQLNSTPDSMQYYAAKALIAARTLQDTVLMVSAKRKLGYSYQTKGELDSSFQEYIDILSLVKAAGLSDELGKALLNIGTLYLRQGDALSELSYNSPKALEKYDQARNFYREGLEESAKNQDSLYLGKCQLNLASIEFRLDRFHSAIAMFEEAREYWPLGKRNEILAEIDLNILACRFELDQTTAVNTDFEALVRQLEGLKQYNNLIVAYTNMAGFLFYENPIRSEGLYLKADSLAEAIGDIPARVGVLSSLAELQSENAQHQKAFQTLQKFITLESDLMNAKSDKVIADLQEKYRNVEISAELDREKSAHERAKERSKFILIATFLLLLVAFTVVLFVSIRNRLLRIRNQRDSEQHLSQLKTTVHDKEMEKMNAVLEKVDEMKDKMSRELHDRLGGTLSAVRMFVQSLEGASEDGTEKVCKILDAAIEETRGFSHELNSTLLHKFGLESSVNDFVETINENSEIACSFEYDPHIFDTTTNEQEYHLNRIIQECFSNTLKHAKATQFDIRFQKNEHNSVLMSVSDNGIGFETNEHNNGIGMENMKVRCLKIEADLVVHSGDHGTTILVTI